MSAGVSDCSKGKGKGEERKKRREHSGLHFEEKGKKMLCYYPGYFLVLGLGRLAKSWSECDERIPVSGFIELYIPIFSVETVIAAAAMTEDSGNGHKQPLVLRFRGNSSVCIQSSGHSDRYSRSGGVGISIFLPQPM